MTQSGRYASDGGAGGRSQMRASDLTVGDYANGMPSIRIGEMFKSFARQLIWMIPLLLVGCLVAWFMTKDLKRTYEGEGRILVQLGSEYVYESVTSNNQSSGLTLTPDHIVLNEIGLMKNTDIIARVVGELRDEFGEKRLAKSQYSKIKKAGRDPIAKKNAIVDLYRHVDKNYVVIPKPKSSVVDLVFKHEDPDIAVRGINLFISAYMDARKDIFVEGSSDVITERRIATEEQLDANEREIQQFLKKHNISDFDSEQGGARKRTEELRATLNTLRASMSETETALATVENQLRDTPEQIDLYVDDRASQRVAQAELELKQLLAKYLPSSNPVRQKQEELRLLKEVSVSNSGRAAGGRRVGPNTVYQALLTRRNSLQSAADSYREKEFTLQRQLDSVDAKVRKLNNLTPTFSSLQRERGTLDTRLKSYTSKEQEALINQQQAQADSENVRIISVSDLPRKGRNQRMIMFALAVVGWGFTVFMLGLLRVFLDPRLYAPSAATERSIQARRQNDYIPEPVMAFSGPAATAAAASAASVPSYAEQAGEAQAYAASGQLQSYSQPQAYGTQGYGTQAYGTQGHGAQGYDAGGYDATGYYQNPEAQDPYYGAPMDGNAAYDYSAYPQTADQNNPYLSGAGMPSGQASAYPTPGQAGYIPSSEDQ